MLFCRLRPVAKRGAGSPWRPSANPSGPPPASLQQAQDKGSIRNSKGVASETKKGRYLLVSCVPTLRGGSFLDLRVKVPNTCYFRPRKIVSWERHVTRRSSCPSFASVEEKKVPGLGGGNSDQGSGGRRGSERVKNLKRLFDWNNSKDCWMKSIIKKVAERHLSQPRKMVAQRSCFEAIFWCYKVAPVMGCFSIWVSVFCVFVLQFSIIFDFEIDPL